MEASVTEDTASEYTDWEIPPNCVEVLKENGCITSDEQGQLILKQDCVEKAREIVSHIQNNGGQSGPQVPLQQSPKHSQLPQRYFEHSALQNTMQAGTGQSLVQENHVQASSRSADEMMVARFMADLPQPPPDQVGAQYFQRPPGPIRGSPGMRNNQFGILDPNDIKKMYQSPASVRKMAGDGTPTAKTRKSAEKGTPKPRKPTKKQLAAAGLGQLGEVKTGELPVPVSQQPGYRVVGPPPPRMSKVGPIPVIPQAGTRLVGPAASPSQPIMSPPVRNSTPQAMLVQNNQTFVLSNVVRGSVVLNPGGPRQPSAVLRPIRAITEHASAVVSEQNFVRPQIEGEHGLAVNVAPGATVLRPVSLSSSQIRPIGVTAQGVRAGNPALSQGQIVSFAGNYQNGQKDGKVEMRSAGYLLGHLPHTSSLMQQRPEVQGAGRKRRVMPVPIPLNGNGAEGSQQSDVMSSQQVQQIVASASNPNDWSQENGVVYTNRLSAGVHTYVAHGQTHEAAVMQQGSLEQAKSSISDYQQQFVVSVGVNPNGSPQKGGGKNKRKNKQSLESRMYWTENSSFVQPRKIELAPGPATPVISRIQPVSLELVRHNEKPIKPREPGHIPKFIPGKLALCGNCGSGSKDVARCHTCGRNLPSDVKLVDDTRTGEGTRSGETKPLPKPTPVGTVVVRKVVAAIPTDMTAPQCQPQTASPKEKLKRPPGRKKKVNEEPECLTLSSDDEGDKNQMQKIQDSPNEQGMNEKDDFQIDELDVNTLIEGDDLMDYCMGYMTVAKFGIYNSKIEEKSKRLIFVQCGIHIPVENMEGETTSVWIPKEHINLIEYNMDGRIRLVTIHVVPKMARWIRNRLKIKKEDNMFDVESPDAARKRILIMLDPIRTKTEDLKQGLMKHFSGFIQEKSDVEVNNILASYAKVVVSYVDKKQLPPTVINQSQDTLKIVEKRQPFALSRTLFTYPPAPEKGGISITGEDYVCLEDEQFLNDSMIDFYMKYLHMTKLAPVDRDRIHIFSTYFYKRLTHRPTSKRRPAFEDDPTLSPEEKRHCRVKSWTKNVDIFDKDYLLVPICEKSHWFLAIICFPYLQGPVLAKDNTPVVLPPTPKRKPRKKQGLEESQGTPGKTFMIGSTTITPVGGATLDEIKSATLLIPDDSDRDEAESDSELEEGVPSLDETQSSTPDSSQSIIGNAASTKDYSQSDAPSTSPKSEPQSQNSSSQPNANALKPQSLVVAQSSLLKDSIDNEPIKQPCVLVFDSLEGPSRGKIVATLREYLRIEYKVKKGENRPFKDFVKGVVLRVPQQTNYSDCGLYVLQYAENFFEDNPIKDFRTPIPSMRKWFDPMVVIRKREDLGNLIIELTEEQNPGLGESLPILRFPTLEGELIRSEDDEGSETYEQSNEAAAFSTPSSPEKLPQMGSYQVITPAWRDGQNQEQETNWNEETEVIFGSELQEDAEQPEEEWTEDWEGEQEDWEQPIVEEIAGEVEVNAEMEGDDYQCSQKREGESSESSQKSEEHNYGSSQQPSETIVTVTTKSSSEVDNLKSTDPNFSVTTEAEENDLHNSVSSTKNHVETIVIDPTQLKKTHPKLLKIITGDSSLVRPKDIIKRTKSDSAVKGGKGSKRQKLVDYADSEDSS